MQGPVPAASLAVRPSAARAPAGCPRGGRRATACAEEATKSIIPPRGPPGAAAPELARVEDAEGEGRPIMPPPPWLGCAPGRPCPSSSPQPQLRDTTTPPPPALTHRPDPEGAADPAHVGGRSEEGRGGDRPARRPSPPPQESPGGIEPSQRIQETRDGHSRGGGGGSRDRRLPRRCCVKPPGDAARGDPELGGGGRAHCSCGPKWGASRPEPRGPGAPRRLPRPRRAGVQLRSAAPRSPRSLRAPRAGAPQVRSDGTRARQGEVSAPEGRRAALSAPADRARGTPPGAQLFGLAAGEGPALSPPPQGLV